MTVHNESPASAEMAALRLRQRQIGRELRLFYERLLREPLPDDMLDALIEADLHRQTLVPRSDPTSSGR